MNVLKICLQRPDSPITERFVPIKSLREVLVRIFSTIMLSTVGLGMALGVAVAGPASLTVTSVSTVGDAVTLVSPVGGNTTAGPIILQTSIGTLVTWCDD